MGRTRHDLPGGVLGGPRAGRDKRGVCGGLVRPRFYGCRALPCAKSWSRRRRRDPIPEWERGFRPYLPESRRQIIAAVEGFDAVECPNCQDRIIFREDWHPLRYVERDADDYAPRSLYVIGADQLLHSCPIADQS